MKHLAAYLLLGIGGKTSPTAEDINGVLSSVGIEGDNERISALLKEMEGKDLTELIAEGTSKFASMPSGGAVGGGAGGAAAAAAAGGDAAPAKEEEKKEEEKEESDDDMGFGLFD